MEQAFRSGVQRREGRIVDAAGDDHPARVEARAGERGTHERGEAAQCADDDEPEVPVAFRRARERAEEPIHVLARIELPDVEDVASWYAEAPTRRRPTVGARRRGEGRVDSLRDDAHA